MVPEFAADFAETLAWPHKQAPSVVERVVETVQRALLGFIVEIDEEVTTRHNVHLCKGRVSQHIMGGEHQVPSQTLGDGVAAVYFLKITLLALFRERSS